MILPVVGPFTRDSAHAMRREVLLGVEYYQYRTVCLEIDSEGGELAALGILYRTMQRIRRDYGVVVSTHVIGEAASAAALVASLGCVGHRTASPDTRLLYHDARVQYAGAGLLTRSSIARIATLLDSATASYLDILSRHVWDSAATAGRLILTDPDPAHHAEVTSREELSAVFQEVLSEEAWLTAEQAAAMKLIDRVTEEPDE